VRKENLCLIPDGIDIVNAGGIPDAYLTAQIALSLADFKAGKTVLAPAIGGSVGNAVTQLARALGAKHAISSTTSHKNAEQAKSLVSAGIKGSQFSRAMRASRRRRPVRRSGI
jgi:NADPH2:quinone reductase